MKIDSNFTRILTNENVSPNSIRTSHVLHVLLEMTKPNNDILFVFFEYCDCTENIVRI